QIAPISPRHSSASFMRSALWRGSRTSRLSANTVLAPPFSAQPTSQPSDGLPSSAPTRPVLARMTASPDFVTGRISRTSSWQRPAAQPIDEIDLLDRIDAQIAGQPELVDAATDVAVAIFKQIDIFLHPLRADTPGDLLIDRHGGCSDRRAQGVVAIPALDASD